MLRRLAVAIVVGIPALFPAFAWAANTSGVNEFPQPPGMATAMPDPRIPEGQPFSQDTPIERLAANPNAAAILDKYVPSLLQNPRYPMFKTMSLKTVAAMSGGRISAETVNQVDAQLKALPVTTAAAAR